MIKNKNLKIITRIVLLIALCMFLYAQVSPSLNSSKSNKSQNINKKTFEPSFSEEARGYFLNTNSDTIGDFRIELAETTKEIQIGMMWRKSMSTDIGMLFLMPEEKIQSFWMKNTYIPLDIIYINSKNQVVSIKENAKPMNESPLPSEEPAIYVLEISGGTSAKLGIKPGNTWKWEKI